MNQIATNQLIPLDIGLLDINDQQTSLRQFLGSWLIIYFYPKDNTPGCTIEACSFRNNFQTITNLGIKIIGISKDSPLSHQKFQEKHQLPFQLLSDTDHELIEAFGCWQPQKFMGREFMGIVRSTFLIDPQGIIRYVWPKVAPKGHAEEILKKYNSFLENLDNK